GDVVGGDGEGEGAAVGVTVGHHIDVGAVDQVHLGLQVAVGEVAGLAADERLLIAQVLGTGPVEREVGEGALRAPAAGDAEVVDQFLHALAHLPIAHRVQAHERGGVGVERAEGLGAGPFVLQGGQEVHDLYGGGGEVGRRSRG